MPIKPTKAIVNAYVRRIQRGAITLEDVPESARKEVEEALKGQ